MIVIGSHALRIGLEKGLMSLDRTPVDLDLIARIDEARNFYQAAKLDLVKSAGNKWLAKAPDGKMVEIEISNGDSTDLYLQWAESIAHLDQAEFYGVKVDVAPLEMLYSLKRAHRHSPRMFHKHVQDYNLLREIVGRDVFSRVTTLRYQETVEREKLKTPSLNKTVKDFFDDKVSNRTFVHDQIHEVMAFGERPMFEKIKIDPDKVACSKEKFFNSLTETQRTQCVQEEAYVIALERAMIPMLFEGERIANAYEAYKWAVMRICTTLCSGWFREYALENYDKLLFWYDAKYVEKFLKAVEDGRIERIQNE